MRPICLLLIRIRTWIRFNLRFLGATLSARTATRKYKTRANLIDNRFFLCFNKSLLTQMYSILDFNESDEMPSLYIQCI